MPRPSTGGIVTGHHEEAHQQIRPAIYGTAISHITPFDRDGSIRLRPHPKQHRPP